MQMRFLLVPGVWRALKQFYDKFRKSESNKEGIRFTNTRYVEEEEPTQEDSGSKYEGIVSEHVPDKVDASLVVSLLKEDSVNMEGLTRLCEVLSSSGKASDRLLPELKIAMGTKDSSPPPEGKKAKPQSKNEAAKPGGKVIAFPASGKAD
jgi:hypothetical protein